jgi:signal transduction histidine kinase
MVIAGGLSAYRLRVRNIAARNRDLETQVARRTAELQQEVNQRTRIEAELRQREMEEAVAAERSRLARDLHDAVTQTLFSASIISEALPALWDMDEAEGRRRLEELRKLNRGALAEMRTLLLELRPSALLETGLDELLRQLGLAVGGRSGISVNVIAQGRCTIPEDVHIALYRIAQEALNNVVKHADAQEVTLSLYCLNELDDHAPLGLELCISDDGCGFDLNTVTPEHLGLGIMRERAQSIGALFELDSQLECGTRITVTWYTVPWEHEERRKGEIYERIGSHSSYAGR